MDEAIECFENTHGSIYNITNEEHFLILNDYAYNRMYTGQIHEAIKSFKYIIDHCQGTSFSYNAYYLACNNLAAIYMEQNNWKDAAKLLEKLQTDNNERNAFFTQNLAICYLFLKEYNKSVSCLKDYNDISINNIIDVFSKFSEIEREKYWTQISTERIVLNNAIAFKTNNPEALSQAYNNTVFCKSFLLNATKIFEEQIKNTGNPKIVSAYQEYKSLRSKLAYKTYSPAERDSLKWIINRIEQDIINSIDDFAQRINDDAKKWTDVQNTLENDEVALEFCYIPIVRAFQQYHYNYGAFVIRKGYKAPILVLFDDIDNIEDLLYSETLDEIFISNLYKQHTKQLYAKLWVKLEPYLNGVKTVYYSPTGELATLNFDIVSNNDGVMLNEKYNMIRVSSTANIDCVKQNTTPSYTSSALYGNINYNETTDEMAVESAKYDFFSGASVEKELTLRSENERGRWGDIPSTKREVSEIGQILESKEVKVNILEGRLANEESFKYMSGQSPNILHFATHGFVIDTKEKGEGNKYVESTNTYSDKESYMMWAGLLMAGANNVWQGKFQLENVEDGILTADEISRLDLSNTNLVVLSACETARGKVDPIDGVFGLQRGFKKAGAQTIVMSLWKVQDDATCMLMTSFYKNLMNGEERHKALWNAMMEVRKVYEDPYYWGGFILLD